MNEQTLSFSQVVETTPDEAFRAFTNSGSLREWLCDSATVVPHLGGRFYLWWNSGYYTSGEYTELEPGKKAAFTWRGRGEPSDTLVQVSFSPQDGSTLITLDHEGIDSGEDWEDIVLEIKKGWKNGLENLASICATGEDLRFVMRPMLGILVGDFNPEIAKQMGLPITEGIRLSGTLEGMGAKSAGLQAEDVIVGMGGFEITDSNSFGKVISTYRAGDTIEVEFFRDQEKKSVSMELSGRPIPEIPWTPKALSEAVSIHYRDIETRLDEFLDGVTEEEASFKPSPEEWSIKGNLVHFIQEERSTLFYIGDLVDDNERFSDGTGSNLEPMLEATIAAYPSTQDLVLEYKRNMAETLNFLTNLPEEFVARKGAYWRLAYGLLEDPYHFNGHLEQMERTLDQARKK